MRILEKQIILFKNLIFCAVLYTQQTQPYVQTNYQTGTFLVLTLKNVHHFVFSSLRIISKIPGVSTLIRSNFEISDPRLEREVFGLKFKNPVGLAAGFDKDARLYKELDNLGFGFIEIGTLTPKAQPGNPKNDFLG